MAAEGGEPVQHKRTIVIAFDGSKDAEFALDWFVKEIHKPGDNVILVHTPQLNDMLHSTRWNNSVYAFDRGILESMLKDEQKKIQENLESYAQIMKAHKMGGRVKSVVATQPGEGVIQAAEQEGADLIVTGCRGLGSIRRTFMGSVSDFIVHHSPVPVIVCRHKE